MQKRVILKQICTTGKGSIYQIYEPKNIKLGRDITVDISIPDATVSRKHTSIIWEKGFPYIEDLSSRNGTFINGYLIEGKVKAKNGDILSLSGKFDFKIEIEDIPEDDSKFRSVIHHSPDEAFSITDISDNDSIEMLRDLNTLYMIGNLISSENELDSLLGNIGIIVSDVINPDRTVILLDDSKHGELREIPVFTTNKEKYKTQPISFSIVNKCMRERISVISEDALSDNRFEQGASIISSGIRSVMCAPIRSSNDILGVLYVDSISKAEAFKKRDLILLSAIGKQSGVAVARAILFESRQKLLLGAVDSLVALIEAKDRYTHGHSAMVTYYSIKIAEELKLLENDIKDLKIAALLHDIGKVGIPENILHKKGRLTDEEFEIIKNHPEQGASIIKNIDGTERIVRAIRHHHERYDGFGYPDRIKGEEIPVFARILAVADSYDAMTSNRPYRKKLSREDAMREIEENIGTQFDPDFATIFLEWLKFNNEPAHSRVFSLIEEVTDKIS
ncbi:MAG: HD domain-containing phosphohydrolase [Candidatus Zixiibacteriota bacterium]